MLSVSKGSRNRRFISNAKEKRVTLVQNKAAILLV